MMHVYTRDWHPSTSKSPFYYLGRVDLEVLYFIIIIIVFIDLEE